MAEWVAFALGLGTGALTSAATAALLFRRARRAWTRRVSARLGPPLARHAASLGIPEGAGPAIELNSEGDLELRAADPLEQLLRLAETIEAREQAQLGYVDTIRVSKDEVDAELPQQTGPRPRPSR